MSTDTVVLKDSETGSEAAISVKYGFNCYQFTAMLNRAKVPVLWSVDNYQNGEGRASGSGIPILFPYPGRIRDAQFTWQGNNYQLEEADGAGNAIHGFVHTRAWRVVEQSENSVTGEFQASVDAPEILERWPADFIIRVTYQLVGNQLSGRYQVQNPDSKPLPFGLGTHPYFQVPLGSSGNADECLISVPYQHEWKFVDKMASGEKAPRATEVDTCEPFSETNYDNAFGGLVFMDGDCYTSIEDPTSGHVVTQTFSPEFTACVLYNPPHREAFCIEPYTCVPDPYCLEEDGVESGLQVLEPGASFEATVDIEIV
ncbi:MAG: aldose epimerase [Blastopirellula sp.]|nr:MAG: aldose epimerase [Blastopirellula sp.]